MVNNVDSKSIRDGPCPLLAIKVDPSEHAYVDIIVHDSRILALIDSGAAISVADSTLFTPSTLNNLQKTSMTVSGVSGAQLNVLGITNIMIAIGDKQRSIKVVIVKKMSELFIIGRDFLAENKCEISYKSMTFACDMQKVPLLKPCCGATKRLTMTVSTTEKIPPFSTKIIEGKIKHKGNLKSTYLTGLSVLVEPRQQQQNVVACITNVCQGKALVTYINNTEHPLMVYRNQVLADVSPISNNFIDAYNANHLPEGPPHFHVAATSANNQQDASDVPLLMEKLGIHKLAHLTIEQKLKAEQLITKYENIFSKNDDDIGCSNLPEHTIVIDTDIPIRAKYRPIPVAQREYAEKEIKRLMDLGIIEPTSSPYHSPAFLVKRPKGGYRLVCDFRAINKHIVRSFQPLPAIESITHSFSGCSWFSKMDMNHGYFQVKLSEQSKPITACSIPGIAMFQFTRVPLGITSAVGHFQGAIEQIMMGLKNSKCVCYLDDVASAGKTFNEMYNNLELIFEKLSEAGLKLKPQKCELFRKTMDFLGLKLSNEGISAKSDKIDAIVNMMPPKTKKSLRSFYGLASYYRRFIPGFASEAKPLTDLLKKDTKFAWGPDQEEAFQKLKTALINPPILEYPDTTKPFYLTTDASSYCIGCILSQMGDDNRLHPVAFASNTLDKTQQHWSSFQREFYALKFYCLKFRHYLIGKPFIIQTDHQALVHIHKFKDVENHKLWRWFLDLSQFDFTVEHIPGKVNASDGPSRLPRSNDNLQDLPSDCFALSDNQKKQPESSIKCYSPELIAKLQDHDHHLAMVKKWVITKKKPEKQETEHFSPDVLTYWYSFSRLSLENNVLYRSWERLSEEKADNLVCVPIQLQDEIIKECHEPPTSGHVGKPKTVQRIRSRFYWPRMEIQVSTFIDGCILCIKKAQKRIPKAPLTPFNGSFPNDLVQIDILENLPPSQGYKAILVIIDRFTMWSEAVPLTQTKTPFIAKALMDWWICRHGVMRRLHSDRGSQLHSAEIIKAVYEMLDIKKTATTAYRPMSDGASERMIRTLKNLLWAYCQENPKNWLKTLQHCMLAYRTSEHSATGYSPFFLQRGIQPRLPIDLMLDTHPNQKTYENQGVFARKLFKTLKDTYHFVDQRLQTRRDLSKTQYDKDAHVNKYKVGDWIYVWKPRPPGVKNKFFDHYFGPFKILKLHTDFTYKIDLQGKSRMYDIVHHDHLRLAPTEAVGKSVRDYLPEDIQDSAQDQGQGQEEENNPSSSDMQTPDESLDARNDSPERPIIDLTPHQQGHLPQPQAPVPPPRIRRNRRAPDFYQAGY